MLAALIIAGSLALLAVVALVVVLALGARLRPAPKLVGRTVVIHTRRPDDQSLRGILYGQYADRWTLCDASVVTALGEHPAGGLQHVPVANIAWVQEIHELTGAEGGRS